MTEDNDNTAKRYFSIVGKRLVLGDKTLVMGVVNATPDSFFDVGAHYSEDNPLPAIERAVELIEAGADIIDIGGETAQPASSIVAAEEEIRRVVPVIKGLRAKSDIPISVDTYKVAVARAALCAGAQIINDTSGLADPKLADVAAEFGAGIVCMHLPGHPKERHCPGYPDPVAAVREFWLEKISVLRERGVENSQILLDPGIGFGKTPQENLQLIAKTAQLRIPEFGLLFACSRRTFLGDLMGGQTPAERLEATVAVNAHAIVAGADIIRVHDVEFMHRLAKMLGLLKEQGAHGGPMPEHVHSEIPTVETAAARTMHTAYIALGSNLGDSESYVHSAIGAMGTHPAILVEAVSSMSRTKAVGGPAQGDYLNGAAKIATSLSPVELLDVLQSIEANLGRVRKMRFGPRTIDLDILDFDNVVMETTRLELPHPRLHERRFALEPLRELAPDWVHPGLGIEVGRLIEQAD